MAITNFVSLIMFLQLLGSLFDGLIVYFIELMHLPNGNLKSKIIKKYIGC